LVVFTVVGIPQVGVIVTVVPAGPKPEPVIVMGVPGGPLAGLMFIDADSVVVVGGVSPPPESVAKKV
jgi:hypothetical protein